MSNIDMITLSREYGAGASELAAELGRRVGWRVLDKDIAITVASRLGLPDDALEEWDEHVPTLLENIGNALMLGSPEILVDPEVAKQPRPEDVAAATRALLLETAAEPPVILVGHGAQALFHDRPATLHLRLVAPLESRIRRICGRRRCVEREAAALVRRMDADRAHYVRQYYGRDLHDPLLYHLQINTGLLGIGEALELILLLLGVRV